MTPIHFERSPVISLDALQELFVASWPDGAKPNYDRVLARSGAHVCACSSDRLIGFVLVAWDGGAHGYIEDTTVHPDFQHQGIGSDLLREARHAANELGVEWLHVDFNVELTDFYRAAGFEPTNAGLLRVTAAESGR